LAILGLGVVVVTSTAAPTTLVVIDGSIAGVFQAVGGGALQGKVTAASATLAEVVIYSALHFLR